MINYVVTIPHVTDHLFRFSRSDVPFMRLLSSPRYTRYVRHRESINSFQKGIYARDSFTRNGSLAASRTEQHLTGISCSKERNHEDGQKRTRLGRTYFFKIANEKHRSSILPVPFLFPQNIRREVKSVALKFQSQPQSSRSDFRLSRPLSSHVFPILRVSQCSLNVVSLTRRDFGLAILSFISFQRLPVFKTKLLPTSEASSQSVFDDCLGTLRCYLLRRCLIFLRFHYSLPCATCFLCFATAYKRVLLSTFFSVKQHVSRCSCCVQRSSIIELAKPAV